MIPFHRAGAHGFAGKIMQPLYCRTLHSADGQFLQV
jgi:hypothetical protein